MNGALTHASFFSGVGGTDLGLERSGWRTVSFSEIDPYACAVLAERWPGVPNLGDVTRIAGQGRWSGSRIVAAGEQPSDPEGRIEPWHGADLWTGGFPRQDLSVAGKRAGFIDGGRSVLAFVFLDLVERFRPPAVLLENVPGLLSSNGGADMGRLLREMAELGYGVAWRILDARHFGVPQRRRRVFILGLRSEADDPTGRVAAERAAQVLAVGTRCDRHPPAGIETGPKPAEGAGERTHGVVADGGTSVRTVQSAFGHHGWTLGAQDIDGGYLQLSPPPDAGRDGAPDGLAGRLDGGEGLVATLNSGGNSGGFRTEPGEHLVTYRKATKAREPDGWERWEPADVSDTLDAEAMGAVQSTAILGSPLADDPLLPLGLDSHRYRCCGNGVVAPVAEWIGRRLRAWLEHG